MSPRLLGCPVSNGLPACVAFCGGGWPGTKITHEQMTHALEHGTIVIDKLACGVLQEQARNYMEEAYDTRVTVDYAIRDS